MSFPSPDLPMILNTSTGIRRDTGYQQGYPDVHTVCIRYGMDPDGMVDTFWVQTGSMR